MPFRPSKPIVPCLRLILCVLALNGVPLHADSPAAPHKAGDLAFWEEIAFWETIKNSKDPSELEAYLHAYPQGRFARLAEIRIQTLKGEADPEPAGETTQAPKDSGEASGGRKQPVNPAAPATGPSRRPARVQRLRGAASRTVTIAPRWSPCQRGPT